MADPIIDWELIFTKLASGIYTSFKHASAETGLSEGLIKAQVLAARKLATQSPRMYELAGRIIARFGAAEVAEGAGGGLLATAAAGISTTALVAGAVVVAVLALAGGYWWSQHGDQPIGPSARATGQACPDMTPVAHNCPWSPQTGVEVGSCKPGYCYDAGYNHTLACKQENQSVPNAHLNDLDNLVCNDGYPVPVHDPCTGLLLRCDAPGGG